VDERDADEFASNLRFHPERTFNGNSPFLFQNCNAVHIPDNNVDHSPADIRHFHQCFDNNYYSYFDIEAIGSYKDHQHSNCFQCPFVNANGFVVNNYRRRHYLMRMPTRDDALTFLVANTDA
jgi:hypothetical protein